LTVEALIESRLALYYVLLLLVLGFSIFFNSKKENRINQTGLAKFYSVLAIIFLIVFILNYAVSDTLKNLQTTNSTDLGYILFILLLNKLGEFLEMLSLLYPVIVLLTLVIGTFRKFILKFNSKSTLDQMSGLTGLNSQKKIGVKKVSNFITKHCYDEEQNITDTGRLIAKISQNMAYTLLILYAIHPIFKYFDINLIFSSITLLFLGITFLEVHFSVDGKKAEYVVNKIIEDENNITMLLKKSSLNELLKFSLTENLEGSKKMIHSPKEILEASNALICEVPNLDEFRNINMKIMSGAFFENKKVLVISSSANNASEYYSKLTEFNTEYDGKIMIKLIKREDKMFDNFADIYISTLENCFGNIKLLNKIDTIVIEDMDVIMQEKLEMLRAFGSIVKMGNSNVNYVVLTYMLQGIEATIKNLLLVKNVTWYSTENKQQPDKITINIWERKEPDIGDKILGKINRNLGSLIPLALIGLKQRLDRILVISPDEPINFQLNELNAIRNLQEKEFINDEIEELNNTIELNNREKYFSYKEKNCILTNDKSNLYEKIYKLSLINGMENHINIVSEQYLLRDYMISTYAENKTRLKCFLPYVPFEVNNSKVVLYDLLLQLTNFGLKEVVISRILNENGISVLLGKGNNIRLIAEKLNLFIKREFDVDVDIYSYITFKETDDKYTFDATKKDFVHKEKVYMLDSKVLNLFPNELFKKVNFTKDGFILDIEGEYAYNFYQKYLPGQKHCLNGHIYEIKNVIDTDNEVNAILEASINYDNNTYRQLRKVHILSDMIVSETKIHKYTNAIAKYMIGTIDFEVDTLGYFEFKNGVTMNPGEYRYVELDAQNSKKVKRKHKDSNALKIEFSKSQLSDAEISTVFQKSNKDNVAEAIAFLISEVLVTMLGENSNYIQVKAVISPKGLETTDYNWVYPIELTDYMSDNIEIYIIEDVHIERGLIDMIYKNLDDILNIIFDYLKWSFEASGNNDFASVKKGKRTLHYLRNFENGDLSLERYKLAKTLLGATIIK